MRTSLRIRGKRVGSPRSWGTATARSATATPTAPARTGPQPPGGPAAGAGPRVVSWSRGRAEHLRTGGFPEAQREVGRAVEERPQVGPDPGGRAASARG